MEISSRKHELPSLQVWLRERSASEQRTLARLWSFAGDETDAAGIAPEQLVATMASPEALQALLGRLRPIDRQALEQLQAEGGVLPAHMLEREFGSIRDHRGFVHPRAYLAALSSPPSATERLFVLGLILQIRQADGLAYAIPAELLPLLPPVAPRDRTLRLDAQPPPAQQQTSDPATFERLLVGLLAAAYQQPLALNKGGAIRRPRDPIAQHYLSIVLPEQDRASVALRPLPELLVHIALDLGLLRRTPQGIKPAPLAIDWLGQTALERRRALLSAWGQSLWDELPALCGVRWRSQPLRRNLAGARHGLLRLLRQARADEWFLLDDWASQVRRISPDFQRPDGIYDSWMLTDQQGRSLVGFQHWEAVEGQLARAVLSGPLHWLGLVDLGWDEQGRTLARLNGWAATLLAGDEPPAEADSPAQSRPIIQPNFVVFLPPAASPLIRFQLSRIAEWEGHDSFDRYLLTRAALNRALDRGGPVEELIAFLERWSAEPLPQNVDFTLRQWAAEQQELRIRPAVLLEAADPLKLEQIRRDRRLELPPFEQLDQHHWAFEQADGHALQLLLRQGGYGVGAALDEQAAGPAERDLVALLSAAEALSSIMRELGLEGAPPQALRQRIERRLSTRQRAEAQREAQRLAERVLAAHAALDQPIGEPEKL